MYFGFFNFLTFSRTYRRWNLHRLHEWLTNNRKIIGSVIDARINQFSRQFLIFKTHKTSDILGSLIFHRTVAQESNR